MRVPKYVVKFINRADERALDELERLIAWRREVLAEPPEPPPSPRREVVGKRKEGKVTVRSELIYCGKNCRGCPHGPYDYAYWWENGKVRSKYIGKTKKR